MNGVVGCVGVVLENVLRKEFLSDVYEWCLCGNLFISVLLSMMRDGKFALDGEFVLVFESFDDLVGVFLVLCYILLYCGWLV